MSCEIYFGTREIRDQVYDEKQNTVTISVLCCSPQKIRDKLCCKGGKVIKSIEIKSPPKPKEPEKPKLPEKPKEPEKPKAPEKPKEQEKPKLQEKPKEPEKPKAQEKPKEPEKPKSNGKPLVPIPAPKAPEPVPIPPQPAPVMPVETGHGYPSIFPYEPCCGPCSQGRAGGPCYHGYGRPELPCCEPCSQGRAGGPCYHGFSGYVYYHGYGRLEPNCYDKYGYNNNNSSNYGYGGRPCYARACDYYPYGENTSSTCTIM